MNNYITILQTQCQPNKYFQIYVSICIRGLNRITPEIYERHHILPKCFKLGGETDIDNIVCLTPREHFICHKLLTKFIFDKELKSKLAYALWQFTKRYTVRSREYDRLKSLLSETYKGLPKTEQHKNNLRKPKSNKEKMGRKKGCENPFKGIKRSAEIGIKISKSKKGKNKGQQNHFFGKTHSEEIKQRLSEINKGKTHSEETKVKISSKLKGREPWNKGTNISIEAKKKASISLSGRKNITNGFFNKRVKLEELEKYLSDGWKLGFKVLTD